MYVFFSFYQIASRTHTLDKCYNIKWKHFSWRRMVGS